MRFSELVQGLPITARLDAAEVEIVDLTSDSREAGPGWCFAALRGEKLDGADFVARAAAQGATAVLADREVPVPEGLAFGVMADPRATLALVARKLHGAPDSALALIGITGTNGKTTTTTLIRQLLRGSGVGCGLIGTVANAAGDAEEEAARTTPESPAFYRWLRRAVEAGDRAVAAEVSSHALCLHRVHGARFRVGVFTNLTQDHLDFHGDMETYFDAKRRLFAQADLILVNADDAFGRRVLAGDPAARSFALVGKADYRAVDLELGPTGTRFTLETAGGQHAVASPLLGRFNASNLLAALAAADLAGFPVLGLLPAVAGLSGAPGRLERVDHGQPFGVVVDYAHTPDALEKILAEGRRLLAPGGRLHVLFGCGGDRDRTKRPLMAAAVAAGADVVWHSSDNPRGEDPEAILDDAAPGIPAALRADPARYHREADRKRAVRLAVADCRSGDLLILAGKGHEPYQEIDGVKHAYSDRDAVETALRELHP